MSTEMEDSGQQPTTGELIRFPGEKRGAQLARRDRDELELADQPEPADRQPGTDLVVDDALDVEVVGEYENPREPVDGAERSVGPIRRVANQVRQHEPTVRTSKWAARQVAYVFAGVAVLANRLWEAKTNSRYERALRAAEAAGDWQRWDDIEQRGEMARDRRHKRRMDLLALPFKALQGLYKAVLYGAGFLLAVGFIVAVRSEWETPPWAPLFGVVDAVIWIAAVVGVAWAVISWVVPFLLVGGLWHVGRQAQAAPRFLMPPNQGGLGDMMPSVLTEDTITAALRDTVAEFDRAVKGGWKVRYRIPPREDQGGTHFQVELPPRAPVEAFVKKRDLLAHNLKRYPIEVWPTEPIAGVLDGWIADPGVLIKPVGPWPLLEDLEHAQCDYFRGIPVAKTLRGQLVASPLSQKNYFLAGIMGSGKSSLAITLALGAILDPLVDVDVVVMAENADYEPMRPALRSLHSGIEPETVEAAIGLLKDRFRSLGELGELLREQMAITERQGREPDKFINREYASREPRLRPRVMIIDECQNLFMSEHGKDAETIVKQLVTTARKYATTLIFLTPDPTGDAVPTGVVRVCSNRAVFAIGDQIGNDAAIGTGSHKIGLTSVNLVPADENNPNDAGTCAARGFTNPPGMMRCFYVPQSDAHRVTKRALQLRGGQQRQIAAAVEEKRDLLRDVAEVLGLEPMTAADVARRLATTFPQHLPYQQPRMTGKELVRQLGEHYGVHVPTTANKYRISRQLIADGIARRG